LKKVALIIGNGDYLHSGRLKNPTNDSRDMKNSLKKLGFEIIYGENLTKKEMNRKLKEFGQIAQGSETALFYYAGHGLQSQGENFLLPIDAEIDSFEDISEESMNFQRVESEFGNLGASNIFILDACRDNPFEDKMKKQASLQGRNIDFSRGLANPNMHIGNSIIAYSTSPNDIALDNPDGENGVYTKYLKTAILETGLSIESVFKRVAKAVKLETSQSQTPWVHSNSDEDIYLNGKEKVQERIVYRDKIIEVENVPKIEGKTNGNKIIFTILTLLLIIGSIFGYQEYNKYQEAKRIENDRLAQIKQTILAVRKWSDEFDLNLPKTEQEIFALEKIDCWNQGITYIPKEIGNLTNLTSLYLYRNKLTELPNSIGKLTNLTVLYLWDNQLTELPNSIGNLFNLTSLSLRKNKLTELPNSIENLSNLASLSLEFNKLTELPDSIGKLSNLTSLSLEFNKLTELPDSIGKLTNLTELYLEDNKLTELPNSIGKLTNLTVLSLKYNKLTELPNWIGNLTNLIELYLEDNKLTELPNSINNLDNLELSYNYGYRSRKSSETPLQFLNRVLNLK